MRRFATIAGLVFALGWPLVLALLQPSQDLRNIRQDVTVVVVEWLAVAILFIIVRYGERRPFFASVGLGVPKTRDWVLVGWFALLFVALCVLFARMHLTVPSKGTILAQTFAAPYALRVLMVFTAGVCEEILFRGFAIERLTQFVRGPWLAALLATVLFALGHLPRYGLSMGLVGVFLIGAFLAALYLWRRNLVACIALHWLVDGISLLIIPAFATLK